MEPATLEVITMHTEVEHTLPPSEEWPNLIGYKFKEIPAWLYVLQEHCHLTPGDRVRITITKEPIDALPD